MITITTSETPQWFWNSQSFTQGKRLPEYQGFPAFTIPNNKVSSSMLRTDTEISLISNQKHPLEKIGHNMFYTNHGGLTNYPMNKLVAYDDIGHNGSNPTNESQWSMAHRMEKIVWVNGEKPLGYNGFVVSGNPSKKAKLQQILGSAIAANPGIEITNYSWDGIEGIRADWYGTNTANLIAPYNNLSLIKSPMLEVGFNTLMQQIYAFNDKYYDFPALFVYQKQLAKLKFPTTKFYTLLWTANESVDHFPLLHNVERRKQNGSFVKLSGTKHNAPVEYVYNSAIVSLTVGDGIIGWEETVPSVYSERDDLEIFGLDITGGNILQQQVGTETWTIYNARVWKSCRLFWDLANYHVSQHKPAIEGTVNDWFTPDFEFNGNMRTGLQKLVPYNKQYKEPIVQLKYNDTKTEACLLVMNNWASNFDNKVVRVIDNSTGLDRLFPVNGTKAELYKITF